MSSCLASFQAKPAWAQNESKGVLAATGGAESTAAVDASPHSRALALFERSAILYQRRDFRGTVDLLQEAYGLFPEPVLLYNLARAYEGLDDKGAAANAYEKYLAAEPTAPDRAVLERHVLALRSEIAASERARAAESSAAKGSPSLGAAPLVIGGIGIAGLGVGLALDLVGQSRHRDAVRQADAAAAQKKQRQAEDLVLGANIGLIGGAVLTATGAAWAIVVLAAPPKPEQRGSIELRLTPASASIVGRF